NGWLAVTHRGAARREHEALYARRAARLEVVERADHVAEAVGARIGDRRSDTGVGREMHDHIHAGARAYREVGVTDVTPDELGPLGRGALPLARPSHRQRMRIDLGKATDLAEIVAAPDREIVNDTDRVVGARRQRLHQVAADEPAAAGDEPAHG